MKKIALFFCVVFIFCCCSCIVTEPINEFDATKAKPLILSLEIQNKTKNDIKLKIGTFERTIPDKRLRFDLSEEIELFGNETKKVKDIYLSSKSLAFRCESRGHLLKDASIYPYIAKIDNTTETKIWSGFEDEENYTYSDVHYAGMYSAECAFLILGDKYSGTESFGELICQDEKLNKTHSGTLKCILKIENSGCSFEWAPQ